MPALKMKFFFFFFPCVQEVIDLTKDLIASQPVDGSSTASSSVTVPVKRHWKIGDKCLAMWSNDGQ